MHLVQYCHDAFRQKQQVSLLKAADSMQGFASTDEASLLQVHEME